MKKNKKVETETKRFKPAASTGLTFIEVKHRQDNGETNCVKNTTEKTYLKIIFDNVFSFFNILMASIAVILLAFVGIKVILNFSFLLLAIVNTCIGTIQECKSKSALKKLKLLNQNKVKVVRDGSEIDIPISEIVLDDIIILQTGDQIPADCILVENKTLEVNESLLTGESVPIKKNYGDSVLAGSFVISGRVKVSADKVGENTYLHSIEAKTKAFKKPDSKLMIGIRRIIKALAWIAIPLSIIVFINQIMSLGIENYKGAIQNAGFIIPYMIPAGMLLLSSVSMMTGVVNLAKKKVLAQSLGSVEALSRIDTLCLDKTGTLTDGTMVVEKTIIRGQGDIDGTISSYMGALEGRNQTSEAIIKKYGEKKVYNATDVIEFSSARKYSVVRFENGDLFAMGAPEYLLPESEELMKLVEEYSSKGSRVVVLAEIISGKILENETLQIKKAKEYAIFIIRDNIRPEVPAAMKWFGENSVDIKVISGDNIGTVSYIAKHSGVKNWDKCVDMSKLTEKDNLEYLVMNNAVFARVSPEQKAEIVDILKRNKRIVGMSGDGINDLIALKKSDCSIALSNGAQATKNMADLVLLDSNFANMKEAVFEGRRVVNNVQRSATLFVMKDFLWMFITIFPILFGLKFDLEPTVMTIVNTFITGIGSLFLAFEPDKRKIEGDFIKNVIGTGIVSGFYMFLPVVFAYIYAVATCGFNVSDISLFIKTDMFPLISICIVIAGFVIFDKICKPYTKYRRFLFYTILLLVIFLLVLIPDFFLMNGTEFMDRIITMYGQGVVDILYGFFKSLFKLEIYTTLGAGQWILIGAFLVFSTTLYKITDLIVSKYLKITMFNPHRFDD